MSVRDARVQAPFGRRTLEIVGREVHGAYVVLRAADPGAPHPDAGQFYMLSTAARWGGGDDERPFLPRAFSVMGVTDDEELQFLIEDVGPGTHRLAELSPGDGLNVVGPLGNHFAAPRGSRRALLVGGGVGIAPLARYQEQEKLAHSQPPLLGFRDAAHAAGAALLAHAVVATDDGSVGHHGLVTDLLIQRLDEDPERHEVYACGPPAMLEAVRALCAARETPAQLALESGMACGFGACFGCVVSTRRGYIRLCLDGPVLDAGDLDSALTPGAGH